MNKTVTDNFSRLRAPIFYLPCLLLFLIFIYLFSQDALSKESYPLFQKKLFLFLNTELSTYPAFMHNTTQLGDGLIILSFLALLVIYAPKLWESLITALIVSGIFTGILKKLFSIKRPAATYIDDHFTIIGEKLIGHNSFPSGHSITTFTVLSIILFAFMPQRLQHKFYWSFCICSIGFMIVATRIGVGAHYPFDVMTGAVIGYISAISGIIINQKYNIWTWVSNKKYYPIFIALFIVSSALIITKILETNLVIFYLSLISLLVSLYVIIKIYVRKAV